MSDRRRSGSRSPPRNRPSQPIGSESGAGRWNQSSLPDKCVTGVGERSQFVAQISQKSLVAGVPAVPEYRRGGGRSPQRQRSLSPKRPSPQDRSAVDEKGDNKFGWQRSLIPEQDRSFMDKCVVATRNEVAARKLGVTPLISPAMQDIANRCDIELLPSTSVTTAGEADLWRQCLSWGVTKTKCRLVAVGDGEVVGACYYTLEKRAS